MEGLNWVSIKIPLESINSNLIVLGDTTQLDTIVYTTERLEIVNANNTSTALLVQQNTNDRDIFVASNVDTVVFKIANNGESSSFLNLGTEIK